jgi:hypothetical protein
MRGGLLMVSVDRYSILDIAVKYVLLILKPSSYSNLNIFIHWGLAGEQVP